MIKKRFFASCAKVAFALAAVVMMSTAFTSCSKDNNDDDGGGVGVATITIDGIEKTVVRTEYEEKSDGNYEIYFYMDNEESVRMNFNKDLHVTGKPIDLKKKEEEQGDKFCWFIFFYQTNGQALFSGSGYPKGSWSVFNEGTLTMSGSPVENINIKLENGRIMGEDNKEHTITLSYSGKMHKKGEPIPEPEPEPKPEPKAKTVTLNGAEKPILKAEYEDKANDNYILYLYLSADGKEKVEMELNKEQHMSGTSIDLRKKEDAHTGFYWSVDYYTAAGPRLIDTYAYSGSFEPVFKTGTLTATGDPAAGTISIKLENGSVVGLDKKEYTLTVSYSGSITKVVEATPLPKPKANIVTLNGAEKTILKALYKDEGKGNYSLYLLADGKQTVEFSLNKKQHMSGTSIDLRKKEKAYTHGEWCWIVNYYTAPGIRLIMTYAASSSSTPVFKTGTLTVSGDPASGNISIKLENGRVIGIDNNEYTLTLSYSGPITKQQ